MKKFAQFLAEQIPLSATGVGVSTYMHDDKDTKLARILGELRLAGIHAGNRDSQQPYTATRSMMALSGAAQRIQGVLMPHGLFIGQPHFVVRESADRVRMKFHVYGTNDETRRLGELEVLGEVNPVDRGLMSFRADLKFPPDYLW